MLKFLQSVKILEKFSLTALKKSVDLFIPNYNNITGVPLYKQGNSANTVFLIKSGEFLVSRSRRIVIDPEECTKAGNDMIEIDMKVKHAIRKY